MTFNVEVVLKGRDFAVTEPVTRPSRRSGHVGRHRRPRRARRDPAGDRARRKPEARADREVILQGFSWIVEPEGNEVVIAIEIPMGAAVAGPFAVGQARLDALITSVLKTERQLASPPPTVH